MWAIVRITLPCGRTAIQNPCADSSEWLLKLHTYGLLNHSFRPTSEIRVLRTYWRQRAEHVEGAATCIRRMQKALTQMNLQLANVISDLSGLPGRRSCGRSSLDSAIRMNWPSFGILASLGVLQEYGLARVVRNHEQPDQVRPTCPAPWTRI